jgi:hypothetical protein
MGHGDAGAELTLSPAARIYLAIAVTHLRRCIDDVFEAAS